MDAAVRIVALERDKRSAATDLDVVAMRADCQDGEGVVGARPEIQCQHESALSLPDHPRTIALRFHAIEGDLVFELIHRAPEPAVPINVQQLLFDQALERALDQLVAWLDVVEDVLAQHEKSA